jgi:hypothetical protein
VVKATPEAKKSSYVFIKHSTDHKMLNCFCFGEYFQAALILLINAAIQKYKLSFEISEKFGGLSETASLHFFRNFIVVYLPSFKILKF